jgi:hypothetical protein
MNVTKLMSNRVLEHKIVGLTYPCYIERKSLKRIKVYYRGKTIVHYPGSKNTHIEKSILAHNNKKYIDIIILFMINNQHFDYHKQGIWVPVRGIFRIINKNKNNILKKLNTGK